jgi:hypothetical protein
VFSFSIQDPLERDQPNHVATVQNLVAHLGVLAVSVALAAQRAGVDGSRLQLFVLVQVVNFLVLLEGHDLG